MAEPPFPAGVDPAQPSAARVYDYLLGGVNNFDADRAVAELMKSMAPELIDAAWANRGFHQRAAKWIAERGVASAMPVAMTITIFWALFNLSVRRRANTARFARQPFGLVRCLQLPLRIAAFMRRRQLPRGRGARAEHHAGLRRHDQRALGQPVRPQPAAAHQGCGRQLHHERHHLRQR
jgi:S-adenosyl methyltransferase